MALRDRLFPLQGREFPAMRWVNISLRALHLLGVAGLGGAYLYQAAAAAWLPYLWLTLGSGVGLTLLYIWNNGRFLIQLRGLVIGLKLLILVTLPLGEGAPWPFWLVVLISAFIAHAPGAVRYWQPLRLGGNNHLR